MTAIVLIVDDIEANVKLLEARLTVEYFETVTAHNGFNALQIRADHAPDVVLLDVMMPAMDGINDTTDALLKRAKQALYCAKCDGRNRVVANAA